MQTWKGYKKDFFLISSLIHRIELAIPSSLACLLSSNQTKQKVKLPHHQLRQNQKENQMGIVLQHSFNHHFIKATSPPPSADVTLPLNIAPPAEEEEEKRLV